MIFLMFLSAGIYWFSLQPDKPSCFDWVKNSNEEGVDCGGVCGISCAEKYPQRLESKIISTAYNNNKADVLFSIENDNGAMMASDFQYVIEFLDSAGKTVASRYGYYSLGPSKKILIVESGIFTAKFSTTTSRVFGINWAKGDNYIDVKPRLGVEKFGKPSLGEAGNFYVQAKLTNDTLGKFNTVDVVAVVYDASSRIIGFNKTQLKDVQPRESRTFRIIWFYPVSGTASKIELSAVVK